MRRQEQIQELANMLKHIYSDCTDQTNDQWLDEAESLFETYITSAVRQAGINLKDLGVE